MVELALGLRPHLPAIGIASAVVLVAGFLWYISMVVRIPQKNKEMREFEEAMRREEGKAMPAGQADGLSWSFGDERRIINQVKGVEDLEQLRTIARIALGKMADKGVTITTGAKPNLQTMNTRELTELLGEVAAELQRRG